MDVFQSITPTTSAVRIAACLNKIYKRIEINNNKKIAEQNKDIEFLKEQIKAENTALSAMSCEIFVRLVKNNILESNNVLSILISMLTNSNENISPPKKKGNSKYED